MLEVIFSRLLMRMIGLMWIALRMAFVLWTGMTLIFYNILIK